MIFYDLRILLRCFGNDYGSVAVAVFCRLFDKPQEPWGIQQNEAMAYC